MTKIKYEYNHTQPGDEYRLSSSFPVATALYGVLTEPYPPLQQITTSEEGPAEGAWSWLPGQRYGQDEYDEEIRRLLNETLGWLAGINGYPEELKSIIGDLIEDVDSSDEEERHKVLERVVARVLLWALGEYDETNGC